MLNLNDSKGESFSPFSLPKFESVTFASRSEYAWSVLLEKYIDNFKIETGVTFQVPVGKKFIDFKIDDVFIEYHPIKFLHEFKSSTAYHEFQEFCKRVKTPIANRARLIFQKEFEAQYYHRRRQLLNNFGLEDKALIVVHNDKDMYRQVLKSFSKKGLPDEQSIISEVNKLRNKAI